MLQVIIQGGDNAIILYRSMTLITAEWESHLEMQCILLHVTELYLDDLI